MRKPSKVTTIAWVPVLVGAGFLSSQIVKNSLLGVGFKPAILEWAALLGVVAISLIIVINKVVEVRKDPDVFWAKQKLYQTVNLMKPQTVTQLDSGQAAVHVVRGRTLKASSLMIFDGAEFAAMKESGRSANLRVTMLDLGTRYDSPREVRGWVIARWRDGRLVQNDLIYDGRPLRPSASRYATLNRLIVEARGRLLRG